MRYKIKLIISQKMNLNFRKSALSKKATSACHESMLLLLEFLVFSHVSWSIFSETIDFIETVNLHDAATAR